MLINQLIFGTARVTGGVDAIAAEQLLQLALDGGIRHIDTAPTYGLGTAEGVVGAALAKRRNVAVTAKVGLPHPRYGYAKSWARRLKRHFRPPTSGLIATFTPPVEPDAAATKRDWDPEFLTRSFARTRQALRRNSVDLLLLHEAYAEDARQPVLDWLFEQQTLGLARKVGFSHGKGFGLRADRSFPPHYVAQCAIDPAWFERDAIRPKRPLILHSIAQTVDWVTRSDRLVAARLERAAAGLTDSPSLWKSALLATSFAILHHRMPEVSFIFATTDEKRLQEFLKFVWRVEAIGVEAIASRFDELEART